MGSSQIWLKLRTEAFTQYINRKLLSPRRSILRTCGALVALGGSTLRTNVTREVTAQIERMKTTMFNKKALFVTTGLLVAGTASAAHQVPAWMGRIQATSCMSMDLGRLGMKNCSQGVTAYANIPMDVSATSDTTFNPKFSSYTNGNQSGCYDSKACGRMLTYYSNGTVKSAGTWVCNNGGSKDLSVGAATVPGGGFANVEVKGTKNGSNSCSVYFHRISY